MLDNSLAIQSSVASEWALPTASEAFLNSLPLLIPTGLCWIVEIILIHIIDEESPLVLGYC